MRSLMRRVVGFLAGVVVGQWLVFGGTLSPADLHSRASSAWEHGDYAGAVRLWSQAVSLQPGNPELHYRRGKALAAMGLRASALRADFAGLREPAGSDVGRRILGWRRLR